MTLLRAEVLKLRKRPATYVTMGVLVVFLLLFYLAIAAAPRSGQSAQQQIAIGGFLTFPTAYRFIASFLMGFGGLLALAYGGAASGAEWAWGTLRVVVARGESRSRYLLVKYAAVALMLLAGVIVAYAVGTVMALIAAGIAGRQPGTPFSGDSLKVLPELVAKSWLGVIEHAALGFLIATLARSQLVGIGGGIALFFFASFASLIPGTRDIVPYLPSQVANAMLGDVGRFGGGGGGAGVALVSPTLGLILTVGYTVIALAMTVLLIERAEIRG